MQDLIWHIWGENRDSEFLTGSREMRILFIWGPPGEQQGDGAARAVPRWEERTVNTF